MQPDHSVKRVLIYRIGSLGDTVVALPCFHLVARAYPAAQRVLLTNFPVHAKAPASSGVIGDSGLVHGYMRYSIGTRNLRELLSLALEIRRFRPDVLVYLMPTRSVKNVRRDRYFFRLAGVRRILGIPGTAEIEPVFDSSTGFYESEASRLARSIASVGDAVISDPASWDLRLNDAERSKAVEVLRVLGGRPLIVCGPGTKMQAKDWGRDNWRALLSLVRSAHPEYGLALIGSREDTDESEYAAQEWESPKVNLCGALSPRETAAVLEHADAFLGPDSGPMHLAASVGVPCVIAFSARGLPGVWYPAGVGHQIIYHQTSCYGCNLETCVKEARRCLTSISVAEMASAVERALQIKLRSLK